MMFMSMTVLVTGSTSAERMAKDPAAIASRCAHTAHPRTRSESC